ncbi:Yip1 family protein [Azospira restricta]|uniref:DUF1282 family protein n=1 Tax=Azospira restricta TaxID=404405 RepID=A0A974PXQ4_9RHOO|nr:Yip1 family protein [Azospira restricta]QRJ63184.1 DUF1282 family protein [Azospira restricta]
MNMMMFPKMLSSHDEGWAWLMRVHPSVMKMMALYVVPMSLIPPAMLLYAASAYEEGVLGIPMNRAWALATIFYIAELVMVPVMAAVIRNIGEVADRRPEYHDAFAFAAVVPTPLWLSGLALFVPNLIFIALVGVVAIAASVLLIYEGTYRVFGIDEEGPAQLLTASVVGAGLVGWVAMLGLAFVSWGWAVSFSA